MSQNAKQVITRFAPSPTGFLHIGGARTALFNWLFARHHGGKFMLRIEDTDRKRSTQEAIDAILDGMSWLGLDWDDEPIFQYSRADRHREVAEQLLEKGLAYRCYATPEELTEMRETAKAEGRPVGYDGRWRDRDPSEAPEGVSPAIRLKAPRDGATTIHDHVQGEVTVQNQELDDMILLRSDGSPTYMLSVVVDDHDMGITHIIRGDDHLTNAFRQKLLYQAMDWETPIFAHIPLIYGPDGKKLSKRHGALGVDAYRDMGYLPDALRNYLVRLGWAHGDDEIFSTEQATEWFSIEGINKSPARFDFDKLANLNGHYIRNADEEKLAQLIKPLIDKQLDKSLDDNLCQRLIAALPSLKERAKDINELASSGLFYFRESPLPFEEKAEKLLTDEAKGYLKDLLQRLSGLNNWVKSDIHDQIAATVADNDVGFGKVAKPLRAALTGLAASPGNIDDIMVILGEDESKKRLEQAIS